MKGFIGGALTAVGICGLILVACTSGCETIEPGYVGIKVNQWGSARGVEDYPIMVGRVSYNPVSETIYKFPVFLQIYAWTKSAHEGEPHDESFIFNSSEGMALNADVAVQYTFEEKKIPHLFIEFKTDAAHIMKGYMHQIVRDELNRVGSGMDLLAIMGKKKQTVLDDALKLINAKTTPKGIKVETLSFLGEIRPMDDRVKAAISSVIESLQQTVQAQNKVAQSKAEADQKIETARGGAESRILEAEAEAKSILAKAKAQAEANGLQSKSLSPELLQWNAIQKWNGQLPQMTGGGALPFVQIAVPKDK
jgi:regulator of protease activity HflC (stomatin/prohibitin superfamily)